MKRMRSGTIATNVALDFLFVSRSTSVVIAIKTFVASVQQLNILTKSTITGGRKDGFAKFVFLPITQDPQLHHHHHHTTFHHMSRHLYHVTIVMARVVVMQTLGMILMDLCYN
jgi:hypothetical protein